MQAEQQVWEDRVEVGAAQVRGRQLSHRHPAGAAAEGEAPALAGDRHVAAEEGAVHEIVLPARVRRELRQLGMDHGAVQALRVVLEDQLPVRAHVVVDAAGGAQVRDVETREPADEGRKRLREPLGGPRGGDHQETPPPRERRGGGRGNAALGTLPLLREDLGRRVVPSRQGAPALPVGLAGLEEGSHGRSTGTITPHRASAPASGAALAGPARPCSLTRMAKSWLPLVAWALLCGRATVLAAQQDGGGRAGLERPIALPTGERRAVELGYGVSHLDIDSLAAAQSPTTLTQLLTGRIAGLVVMQSSGTIGAGSRLLNRGATSLFVSNAPLLYVDGVRADQSPNAYGLDVGGQVPSRFDDVEVADIAAVDVLRGPAATALYGADAANGVILVTTRRGTPGPARIHGAVTQGFVATPRRFPENLLPVDPSGTWCSLIRKAAGGCGQDRILVSNALESPATSPIGHGAMGGYGLDVSGGTGRLRYYAAGRWQGQGGVYGLPTAEVDRLTARANGSGPPEDVRTPNYLSRTSARANVDFHVSPRAAVSLATGYLSSAVRMPINDNNILGVLPSGFLGFGDSTINDGWGFFPPGDVFQIRTSQAVERLTGSLRGTWRPLSFLETSFLVGMDRVRQSDRQVQARGGGPDIAGLRLGRVLAGRANNDHYSIELGARAAFHLSPPPPTRTAGGLQYFNATGDTLLRLGRGLQPGDTSLADAAVQTVLADAQGSNRVTGLFLEQELSLRERLFVTRSLRHDAGLLGEADLAGATYPALGVSWLAPTRADAPLGLLRLRAAYGVAGRRPLLSAPLAAEGTPEAGGGGRAGPGDNRLQPRLTPYDPPAPRVGLA